MPETSSWLSIIGSAAGTGALIDFCLGKRNQQLISNQFSKLWIRLDDVRLNTFGRDEAVIAGKVLRAVFGRFLSIRRALCLACLAILGSLICFITVTIRSSLNSSDQYISYLQYIDLGIELIVCSISISATCWIATIATRFIKKNSIMNILIYLVILALQVALINLGVVTTHMLMRVPSAILDGFSYKDIVDWASEFIIERFHDGSITAIFLHWPIYGVARDFDGLAWVNFMQYTFGYFAPSVRLLLAVLFCLSIFLRPFLNVIKLVVLRLIESDKPIFTLLFGGVAAIIKSFFEIGGKLFP